jgi:putative protease
MNVLRKDIEIMAPAGSFESLMAAIQGGADAVYFGVQQLNMRAISSRNVTIDDLFQVVRICREHQVRSYLTLNTILYDRDLDSMRTILDAAKQAGISAIIASDHAAIMEARARNLEVHVSTQLNISNTESLRFYAQWADVMVLARELTLDQISAIRNIIEKDAIRGPSGHPVRLELFAHGALCMAISGKCYMSLHEKNASANRGACQQTCRKAYRVTERETGHEMDIDHEYIMSPKDLKTIHFLNKILDAGITVLKIEGRARPPEYVKTVVSCYDEAIRSLESGTYNDHLIDQWDERLSAVFNRGFWDGYYLGQRLGEWSHRYGSQATRRKVYLGKGTNYFQKIGVAEFIIETGHLKQGDEILITGPTTGVVQAQAREIRVDDQNVPIAKKGDRCSVPVEKIIRRSDKLYKVVDASQVQIQ